MIFNVIQGIYINKILPTYLFSITPKSWIVKKFLIYMNVMNSGDSAILHTNSQ